jgi:DNA adenine methylase
MPILAGLSETLERREPFLKWPGGKRWLAPLLLKIARTQRFSVYREPFLGGGALFFALNPDAAILSDINGELINTYRQVKLHPDLLLSSLRQLPTNRKTYYSVRNAVGDSRIERAVRFLYLNRTAFGGLYRLNLDGVFNVPFGGGERTPAPLWTRKLIVSATAALRGARLLTCDFEEALRSAGRDDLVYCDPTYTVAHNNNGFVRYNESNFSWEDQKRLAACCHAAARRGAFIIVSNAHHEDLLGLYRPHRHLSLSRTSCLCPDASYRRLITEYIFLFAPTSRLRRVETSLVNL